MQKIIDSLHLDPLHKQAYNQIAKIFQELEPDSLYMTPEELSENPLSEDIDPALWAEFLSHPEIDMYINKRLATILRFSARKQLHNLTTQKHLTSNDVSVAKTIIEKSHLLDQKTQDTTQYITMHIPSPSLSSSSTETKEETT